MQVYVTRINPIQELKEFGGRVLNGVKEGVKENINDIERTAIASGLENGIKGGISGYKQIREFNAVMKNGYTLRGIGQAGMSGAVSGFAKGVIKSPGIVGWISIGWSFGEGFVRGWREYGK